MDFATHEELYAYIADNVVGIILAGGKGTRLFPLTMPCCKQLLPVFDKPMIYYPLSTLILAGIKKILIISTPKDISNFEELFGDGSRLGLSLSYRTQENPTGGLAEAFTIGREHIGNLASAMILGDNIFYGDGLQSKLSKASQNAILGKATIFAQRVDDVSQLGVVELDGDNRPVRFVEKPTERISPWAVLGLYFVPSGVSDIAEAVQPSARNQKEILSVMSNFTPNMVVERLGRGNAWFDCGNSEDLISAAQYIQTGQDRNRMPIGYIEEAALHAGFINVEQFKKLADEFEGNGYYKRKLLQLAEEAATL